MVQAINSRAVAVIRNEARIMKWTKEELQIDDANKRLYIMLCISRLILRDFTLKDQRGVED